MKLLPFLACSFAIGAFLINCTPELSNPKPQAGECDFSRIAAIGGDYTAGYQDGALSTNGQYRCFTALMGNQFFNYNCGQTLTQEVINGSLGWNSKPWESWYVTESHLGWRTDCEGVVSLGPVKDSISHTQAAQLFANPGFYFGGQFGIPFANTAELLSPALGNAPVGNTNPFYYRIASAPGTSTVLGDAVNFNATFFTAWLGMEDIFNYARNGGEGTSIMSPAQFSVLLDSILGAMTANGAKGAIANIPDFRYMPYYTLIPWNGADLTQQKADSLNDIYTVSGLTHIHFHEGSNGFVINDPNAPSGVRQIRRNEYITLGVPLDSMKCNFMGILFSTIPDRYILDSTEVEFIDMNIAAYNAVIAQKATQYNLAFVDMNSYFRSVQTGIKWDGVDLNTTFVSGGFYSLDGYHPNQRGHALIANEFIYAINAKYGSTIPTVNCTECNGVLFP